MVFGTDTQRMFCAAQMVSAIGFLELSKLAHLYQTDAGGFDFFAAANLCFILSQNNRGSDQAEKNTLYRNVLSSLSEGRMRHSQANPDLSVSKKDAAAGIEMWSCGQLMSWAETAEEQDEHAVSMLAMAKDESCLSNLDPSEKAGKCYAVAWRLLCVTRSRAAIRPDEQQLCNGAELYVAMIPYDWRIASAAPGTRSFNNYCLGIFHFYGSASVCYKKYQTLNEHADLAITNATLTAVSDSIASDSGWLEYTLAFIGFDMYD